MDYTVGSLVRVRGREWVVLPDSTSEMLLVRPLGGTDDEETGIVTALELVEPAHFALPDPEQVGDYHSARLLRDAVRLGFRSSAGPFRSFAEINVEPRPYQLVPLLMALRLDPVRLLIADDVGIGKTIEALLIAKELLARGEIQRIAVLCPPHLAEQWQHEMREKFYIDAELVLASTATRLERHLRMGESIFERYPFVIVSTDFIKSERRRDDFLRACPEFVIVDEAHSVAHASGRGRHQRYELVKSLSERSEHRHMVLVTATPHSGKEDAFRSLLALVNPDLADLPEDLSGPENAKTRQYLAQFFVQRRRGDIKAYDTDTGVYAAPVFPEREVAEPTYDLSPEYKRLFDRIWEYARQAVLKSSQGYHQRVQYWSALALLRSLASSPAAAAATLRTRAATIEAETEEGVDDIGERTVLDWFGDEASESVDVVPGSDVSELDEDNPDAHRRRLLEFARQAEALEGDKDAKLQQAIKLVKRLIKDGYSPILFCRFIPTVEYVTDVLRRKLRGVEVIGVTGTLPPAEREERVAQLVKADKRVLVCTDCLSEGINLHEGFDAVVHYDLSWNPTRHEQREGRVDRYGQPRSIIKVVTYYGADNGIDQTVVDVLLRKHTAIRNSLGVSIPVPGGAREVIDALVEGFLQQEQLTQPMLPGIEDQIKPRQAQLDLEWDEAAGREKRSRTVFAQHGIKVEEVSEEFAAARAAIGAGVDVKEFMINAIQLHRGVVSPNGAVHFDLAETPRGLRELVGHTAFAARFELPVKKDQLYLTRTHPIVESMASYVMDSALDPVETSMARRCGVVRTSDVEKRTTLLLLRFRYHIITTLGDEERQLLAEDCQFVVFRSSPANAEWLDPAVAEELLDPAISDNVHLAQAADQIRRTIEQFGHLESYLNQLAQARGQELLDAHRRVRTASRIRGVRYRVEPQLPPDVLGIYVYLPSRRR